MQMESLRWQLAMTYEFTNYQQTCKFSMGFTFCQFSEVDILKLGSVVPNSILFYARWNIMGVEN